jgi:hypothetical protein
LKASPSVHNNGFLLIKSQFQKCSLVGWIRKGSLPDDPKGLLWLPAPQAPCGTRLIRCPLPIFRRIQLFKHRVISQSHLSKAISAKDIKETNVLLQDYEYNIDDIVRNEVLGYLGDYE